MPCVLSWVVVPHRAVLYKLVVDHFGFFLQSGEPDEVAWEQLLSLAR